MIPGNIDLTENLDFRKVVQKEIPQLPDNWKKSELITDTEHISTFTSTTNSISINNNSTYTYHTTYYNDEDEYGLTNTNITSSSLDSISDWTGWITYYDRDTSVISDITFSYDDSTISYNSGNHFKIITKKKKEYDIFGNEKIDYVEEIPSIPWSLKQDNLLIRDIPWRTYKYYTDYEDDEIPSIPWDEIPRWSRVKRFDLDSIVNRAKNLICWLSDKSNRFIENYLDKEEEVDLSYLTNMSWIRVRDAVIDTV